MVGRRGWAARKSSAAVPGNVHLAWTGRWRLAPPFMPCDSAVEVGAVVARENRELAGRASADWQAKRQSRALGALAADARSGGNTSL